MTLLDPNAAAFEPDDPSRAEPPRLAQGRQAAFGVMKRRLADHPFLIADRYTIADMALYAYTHVADEGGFDLMDIRACGRGSSGWQRCRGTFRSPPASTDRVQAPDHR